MGDNERRALEELMRSLVRNNPHLRDEVKKWERNRLILRICYLIIAILISINIALVLSNYI